VIAGAAFAVRAPQVTVETAGTLTIDGHPASFRTRAAMDAVGLDLGRHRSRQVTPSHLDAADLIVALAPEHVSWVRREHPNASPRTATLKRLARDLPLDGPLDQRISSLDLAAVALESWEEVDDPAGAEVDVFISCAREIVGLVDTFVARLGNGQPVG
jgi:protein-tyrosine-phosphatase